MCHFHFDLSEVSFWQVRGPDARIHPSTSHYPALFSGFIILNPPRQYHQIHTKEHDTFPNIWVWSELKITTLLKIFEVEFFFSSASHQTPGY